LEKRLPLFLFLAFLVFFVWRVVFPPPPRLDPVGEDRPSVEAPADVKPGEASAEGALVPAPAVAEAYLADDTERTLELLVGGAGTAGEPGRRGAFRARFSNRGARLTSLELADYVRAVGLDPAQRLDPANWLPLLEPVESTDGTTGSLLLETRQSSETLAPGGLGSVLWRMEELAAPEIGVRFRYSPPGGQLVLEKKIVFEPGSWHLRVALTLENLAAGAERSLGFALTPAGCMPAELGDRFYTEPTAVAIGRSAPSEPYESDHKAAPGLKAPGALEVPVPLTLAGLHNKYFAFLVREAVEGTGTLGGATYEPVRELGPTPRPLMSLEVLLNLSLPRQGASSTFEYVVYAGPKEPGPFTADCAAHQLVLDDDLSVDSIAKGLLYVLRVFEGGVGNWGIAIILLTLCVRLVLFPLNRRSQTSMARYQKKMKRVQPRLEEAKKRFQGDPQKLREAQARIMQEEGAFPPLGGCAPIFLQMPIFFGLFSALRTSFDLRQAPFYGWITDLSRPDRLLHLGLELPILPDIQYLNVLPILMVVLWVLQQMGMPKPADEQAARMQKMMMFMPVVFGFMLYNYAAGLSLYMITTSSCSIIEQKVIKKLWPIDDTELPVKEKKGCGPFSGIMQHLAEKQREQMKRVQAMQNQKGRQEGKRRK
jgi:YidC/Oxa1 family membrane protein insertase